MSAAIAMAPSPAPHERGTFASERPAPPTVSMPPVPVQRNTAAPSQSTSANAGTALAAQPSGGDSPKIKGAAAGRSSPTAFRNEVSHPSIIVKKEPVSPGLPASRHRPRRLDLSKNKLSGSNPPSALPVTTREGLGIQEVGIACLSPGFVTQDPVMKEQLQRSISVREQQRSLIEARLQQQQSAKGDGPFDKEKEAPFSAKTPGMSRRNKAPPGLSIVAPSHQQFANERVIQSAPLGRSFTGRQQHGPQSRHANQTSNLSSTSHIHHVPANQTTNRLPPISDVFGQNLSSAHPDHAPHTSSLYLNHASSRPQMSPGLPSSHQAPTSARLREFKSAEEAQHELSGGRPELLPRLVHYGGQQPPTPPSPVGAGRNVDNGQSTSKRRRAEYEEGGSPPLGHGPFLLRRGPFGSGRDSPETQRAKREEFLQLCARAWDLFH